MLILFIFYEKKAIKQNTQVVDIRIILIMIKYFCHDFFLIFVQYFQLKLQVSFKKHLLSFEFNTAGQI